MPVAQVCGISPHLRPIVLLLDDAVDVDAEPAPVHRGDLASRLLGELPPDDLDLVILADRQRPHLIGAGGGSEQGSSRVEFWVSCCATALHSRYARRDTHTHRASLPSAHLPENGTLPRRVCIPRPTGWHSCSSTLPRPGLHRPAQCHTATC